MDAAVAGAGRRPDEVVKSVALYVQLFGGSGRRMGAALTTDPISGSPDEIADRILAFSPLVDHVQLVVDPITVDSIEALAATVAAVHAAGA